MKKQCVYSSHIKPVAGRSLAIIGMILFWWLYLLIAVCIVVDDPGPVIFTQKRIGKNLRGKKVYFKIYKFRTMKTSTPRDIPTHLLSDPDQFITRVGRFLRKYSLDEIPQLWNIAVTHDLAFIGPRAALYNQDDLYEERERYGVNDITPGITGWAQVNGRDELPIPVKAKYDGAYAEAMYGNSFSAFLMDIRCLVRTIGAVIGGRGNRER